eukprot:gnl/TRDRNA2_/TRDRNA2_177565_c0_seq1.p1 gnl/TRDRNA2_/TRDRNA2_177565_c0~~gnl/TRDRNA2_/TRDRNA2_177565_c0_seq1.p1  ORF type:complete len:1015 (+),score=186.68 gnl/TRDRNA2_/TRDRNA2_177565_c0_seq1:104-3046(+)
MASVRATVRLAAHGRTGHLPMHLQCRTAVQNMSELRKSRSTVLSLAQRHFSGRSSGPGGKSSPKSAAAAAAPAQAASEGNSQTSAQNTQTTVFTLPLYRRPAFPGFYQQIQVSEQDVIDFLLALRKNGQAEYLGGFMTKSLPESATDPEGSALTFGVRQDAGRVNGVFDLEEVGTLLQVVTLNSHPELPGGSVVVMPSKRIRRLRVISGSSPNVPLCGVTVEHLPDPEFSPTDDKIKSLLLSVQAQMKELLNQSPLYKQQLQQVARFYDMNNPLKLADLISGLSMADRQELQDVLQEEQVVEKLQKVLTLLKKDFTVAELQAKVKTDVEKDIMKDQRRMILMSQMKKIQQELGATGKDDKQVLIDGFREAIKDKTLDPEVNKAIESELTKLGNLEPSSSEYNVSRTYLEWLTCLPWGQTCPENSDIEKAERILNEDHFGLEDVKERIMEHIAVSFLKKSVQGKIMCMVGPPGVGKTSIGKSIARALDRKFFRFSVGGLHDVAEIRGHRRTYVGAMPGKLIQCLKTTQTSNPVVLIDEIDKMGRGATGDPTSALLEVLDPSQNGTFRDLYLDVPTDLSQVLFVCTANSLDTIPGPLLDRMEVIRIAGYVHEEKVAIANQYLIPQTKETSGIDDSKLDLQEDALNLMIKDYARESGVRELRKLLEKVSRKVALDFVRSKDEEVERTVVDTTNLKKFIGQPRFFSEGHYPDGTPPGVVMGLAWTSMGGATLFIESVGHVIPSVGKDSDTSKPAGGRGTLQVTGQLGSVMNESSQISLTYARVFMRELDPSNFFLDEARVHMNIPEGATPKDGPSAGVTMVCSLLSLALGRPLKKDVAMTGELTLTGKVLKVGGIKEKTIAARREGVKTLLLPRQCEADFTELKDYLKTGLTVHFIDHFDDYYRLAFEEGTVPALKTPPRGFPVSTVEHPDVLDSVSTLDSAINLDINVVPGAISPGSGSSDSPCAGLSSASRTARQCPPCDNE